MSRLRATPRWLIVGTVVAVVIGLFTAPASNAPADPVGVTRSTSANSDSAEPPNELLGWGAQLPAVGVPDPEPSPVVIGAELPRGSHIDQVTGQCLLAAGVPYCWGGLDTLGRADLTSSSVPVRVDTDGVLQGLTVVGIASSPTHVCAVADNRVFCWGDNEDGELGTGQVGGMSSVPVEVSAGPLVGRQLQSIAVGDHHTCAIADYVPYCWGDNSFGQLGNGSTTSTSVPVAVDVASMSGRPLRILAAGDQTCAWTGAGTGVLPWGDCWGDDLALSTGDPVIVTRPHPLPNAGTSTHIIAQLAISRNDICVSTPDSNLYCLGRPGSGWNLGSHETTYSAAFRQVEVPAYLSHLQVDALSVGDDHSCALDDGGTLCWGANDVGQLGQETTSPGALPWGAWGDALTGRQAAAVFAGDRMTLAVVSGAPGMVTGAGALHPVPDTRVVSSRTGLRLARRPLKPHETVRIVLAGQSVIPRHSGSLFLDVTAVSPTAAGSLIVYPGAGEKPYTAALVDFWPHDIVGSLDYTLVGTDGSIMVRNNSSGQVDVVIDVLGYTGDTYPQVAGGLEPLRQPRVVDTRVGHRPLTPNGTLTWKPLGSENVPTTGVSAMIVRFEATDGQTGGQLQISPTGTINPTSTVYYGAGHPRSDVAFVPIGADGRIRVHNNSRGTVDVVVDELGWVMAGQPTAAGTFVSLPPHTFRPTATGALTAMAAGGRETLPTVQPIATPSGFGCLATTDTVTVDLPTAYGYLAEQPATRGPVTTSLINFKPRQTISHAVITEPGNKLVNLASAPTSADVTINGCFRY